MKTVCKKLLCLMLVAMMLVSAIPAAFAGEVEALIVPVSVTLDGEVVNSSKELTVGTDGVVLDEALAMNMIRDTKGRAFSAWESSASGNVTGNTLTYSWLAENIDGYSLTIALVSTEPPVTEPPVTEPPVTEPPVTEPPVTEPPVTEPPVTEPPVTEPPVTEPPVKTYILSFEYLGKDGNWTGHEVEIENNQKITLPSLPLVNGKDFLYWKDGDGNRIDANTVWNVGESQEITAVYESNTTQDGVVNLTVYANYYVEGEFHHREKLYTEYFEESNKNTMFEWLYSDAGKKQTRDALEAEGYEGYDWAEVKYYNYYGDGEITKASMKTDGNKTVYIKVHSTDEIEANVMLYVHKKETSTVDRVIPMPGYTKGDYVTYSEVKAAVKTKYSGSKMTISDLYTQSDWEDLLDDLDSTGAQSVKVEHNGTTKIHVIVKNASSSTADSSNPKTGDNIMIAVSTMALAAAALVSVNELKKRKMI